MLINSVGRRNPNFRTFKGLIPEVGGYAGYLALYNCTANNERILVQSAQLYMLWLSRMVPLLRVLDIIFSLVGLIVLFPVFLLILAIGFFDTGAPIFRQVRVGRGQKPFLLNKFRTMNLGTDSMATHMVDRASITPLGRFLRASKLDELPQLWNVLRGDMSLVGPRPCLPNQSELIQEREALGVFDARPGITGLAQVRGIDMSTPALLARTDQDMLKDLDCVQYLKLIALTASGKGSGDRVVH